MVRNFQSKSTSQGTDWHIESIRELKRYGFEICTEKLDLADCGIELDAVTINRWGIIFAWEFKGSWDGDRPSIMRTDTLKKTIANAVLLPTSDEFKQWCASNGHLGNQRVPPLFVMASHEPEDGHSLAMLHTALKQGWITDCVDTRDGRYLAWLYDAGEDAIAEVIERHSIMPKPDPVRLKRTKRPPRKASAKAATNAKAKQPQANSGSPAHQLAQLAQPPSLFPDDEAKRLSILRETGNGYRVE